MKKIYLLLTSALLLISSTLFAGNVAKVGDTEYATIGEAIANWNDGTTLTLLKDIELNSVVTLSDGSRVLDLNNHNVTAKSGNKSYIDLIKGMLTVTGTGVMSNVNYASIRVKGADSDKGQKYSVLNIGENVTFTGSYYGVFITHNSNAAYGAEINFGGKAVGSVCAIYVNGSVNKITGSIPKVNVLSTAVIGGQNEQVDGIYAAGYADYKIEGTIYGSNPIYFKAGNMSILNANIHATGERKNPDGNGNGYNGTGDAIMVDTYDAYAGNMSLKIENSTVVSDNGFAVQEAITKDKKTNDSFLVDITIMSGSFIGGATDSGVENVAIKVSDEFKQAAIDGSNKGGDWVINGIIGGTYSSNPLLAADGYAITENEGGTYSINEFKPEEISGKTYITTKTEVNDLNVGANTEIIVKTGATLTVNNTVTIGKEDATNSRVIVRPGGKLIAGNIVSDDAQKLVLESDLEHGNATLIYNNENPAGNPMGTVELATKSTRSGDNFVWQHFGVPTMLKPKIVKSVPATYNDWDVKKGWVYTSGSSAITKPFVGHNLNANTPVEGAVFAFQGNLVSNSDAVFELNANGYTALANSYTAPMDIKTLVNSFDGVNTDGAIWIYFTNGAVKQWEIINADDFEETPVEVTQSLPSMQAFFLGNRGAATSFTVSYDDAIKNVSSASSTRAASVVNCGTITLSDGTSVATLKIKESDAYTDEFEDGKDVEQMETGDIQIYAKSGDHKLAKICTNSINGKIVEIVTKANTSYTLSFTNIQNDGFKLFDLATDKEIDITAGDYTFTADANSTIARFRLGEGTLDASDVASDGMNLWIENDILYVSGCSSEINIINSVGASVMTVEPEDASVRMINISNLASSVYVVKSGSVSMKFIK